ncbi:hypothetical protein EDEG_02176 [Edhazardia aedis USNM 41457]|uniref:Uncharacterized protein n=1 Tax=Edhazardia aedis (strain USNM 41457) TaxID=1003232 RepID=J9DLL4_EDHAE|nr:hypothetical protein EDEG_02176 [Edhazardia aedis USNM 41457]|eukprot:EJW03480.1 hypothetical protein EDEG_02176 [Edhazardia aedis USNM 41457]
MENTKSIEEKIQSALIKNDNLQKLTKKLESHIKHSNFCIKMKEMDKIIEENYNAGFENVYEKCLEFFYQNVPFDVEEKIYKDIETFLQDNTLMQ